MTHVTIPQLDANLVDVTITRWCKRMGEHVQAGEALVEITTDKAMFELEAPATGTLLEIIAQEKSVVPSGYIIGVLGEAGESDPEIIALNQATMERYQGAMQLTPMVSAGRAGTRIRATPRARRLAREHSLDLAEIRKRYEADVVDESMVVAYMEGR